MKTTKDERHFIRMMGANLSDGQVTFNVVNLIDDVDELETQLAQSKQLIEADNAALKKAESKLARAEEMLERAVCFVEYADRNMDFKNTNSSLRWLSDYERFKEGK